MSKKSNNQMTSSSSSNDIQIQQYPIQFEYLKKLQTNHLLSLKQNCLIAISKLIIEKLSGVSSETTASLDSSSGSTNSGYGNGSSEMNGINLESLSIDLRQELIHFMLEYRLLYSSKLAIQSIIPVDCKIRSLDFSVVKSKITIGDPTKDILKQCANIKNLDFSNCYNVNDTFIKIIINNIQSSPSTSISSSTSTSASSLSTSPILLSKSKSIEFNEKLESIGGSSDDYSSASGGSSLSINTNNTIPSNPTTPKKQKLFSLKNKIFSKKKQLDELNFNISQLPGQQQGQQLQQDEIIMTNNLYDVILSPRNSLNSATSQMLPNNENNGLFFLSLCQCSLISDSVIRKLVKLSPNLAYLDLTGCKLSPKTLLTITTTCNKLKTLNIGNIDFPLTNSLAQSISKLSNLASLDLSSIPKLTTSILNSILGHIGGSGSGKNDPTNIHRESISEPPTPRDRSNNIVLLSPRQSSTNLISPSNSNNNISGSGIKKINLSPSIQSLASISSELSNLYTPRSMLSFEMFGVFPNTLLTINLSTTDIDDTGLLILSKKCIYLQDLDISFCTNITNQGLSDMSCYLSTLVTFSAKLVKASIGFIDLINSNLNLLKLDLQYTKIDEYHFKELSSTITNLISIRLDGTSITDELFKSISNNNKYLEIVGLSTCKNISNEIFNILSKNCINLKKFYLSHCKMKPTKSSSGSGGKDNDNLKLLNNLNLFFNNCSTLQVLDIAFTPLVKDQIIQVLVESKCSKTLEALFIGGGFQQLSNGVVNKLVDACNRIKVFSCISCYNIQDDSILYAMDKWLLLEALELTDCTSLTTLTTNFISDANSHLHSHLRFIFFSNLNLEESFILSRLRDNSSLEIFEMNQEITLENVIDQNWINI